MSSKKLKEKEVEGMKDGKCLGFEPQTWRKNMCRVCFRSRAEHNNNGGSQDPGSSSKTKSKGGAPVEEERDGGKGKEKEGVSKGTTFKQNRPTSPKTGTKEKEKQIGVLSPKEKRKEVLQRPMSPKSSQPKSVLSPKEKRKESTLFSPTKSSASKGVAGNIKDKQKDSSTKGVLSPKEKRKIVSDSKSVLSPKEKRKEVGAETYKNILSPKEKKRELTGGEPKGILSPKEKRKDVVSRLASVKNVFSPKEKRKEVLSSGAKSVLSPKESRRRDSTGNVGVKGEEEPLSPKEKRRASLPSVKVGLKGAVVQKDCHKSDENNSVSSEVEAEEQKAPVDCGKPDSEVSDKEGRTDAGESAKQDLSVKEENNSSNNNVQVKEEGQKGCENNEGKAADTDILAPSDDVTSGDALGVSSQIKAVSIGDLISFPEDSTCTESDTQDADQESLDTNRKTEENGAKSDQEGTNILGDISSTSGLDLLTQYKPESLTVTQQDVLDLDVRELIADSLKYFENANNIEKQTISEESQEQVKEGNLETDLSEQGRVKEEGEEEDMAFRWKKKDVNPKNKSSITGSLAESEGEGERQEGKNKTESSRQADMPLASVSTDSAETKITASKHTSDLESAAKGGKDSVDVETSQGGGRETAPIAGTNSQEEEEGPTLSPQSKQPKQSETQESKEETFKESAATSEFPGPQKEEEEKDPLSLSYSSSSSSFLRNHEGEEGRRRQRPKSWGEEAEEEERERERKEREEGATSDSEPVRPSWISVDEYAAAAASSPTSDLSQVVLSREEDLEEDRERERREDFQHQQQIARQHRRRRRSDPTDPSAHSPDAHHHVIGRHKPSLTSEWDSSASLPYYSSLPRRWGGARSCSMDDSGVSRDEAIMEGHRMLVENLREKIDNLEEKCDKLEREKRALGDLLASRKSEFIETEERLRDRVANLEDTARRAQMENERLIDRLKLPPSKKNDLRSLERHISSLQEQLEEAERRLVDSHEEKYHLSQEIKDLQLEMDEMHDQFREDEAIEFRELQKELEATAKNCRILQFKLRKAERRAETVESERAVVEEKLRQLESRFEAADDKQHIRELEEELKMAKEVSVRLHDELELVEEKRVRYEEEVNRLQDYLKESENRRSALTSEVDDLHNEIERLREEMNQDIKGGQRLGVPEKKPTLAKTGKDASVEYDVAQLMRDLSDSLERENDLKEQLQYTEEQVKDMRKKLSDADEENESLNLQLKKMSSAKSGKYFNKRGTLEKEVVTEREHDLRLQLEIAEQEISVLKRKTQELEEQNDKFATEVRFLQEKIMAQPLSPTEQAALDDRPIDEKLKAMATHVDDLKWKLIEKDREMEKLRTLEAESKRGLLKKSRSLDDSEQPPADYKRQFEMVQQEANVLKEKIVSLEKENEKIVTENKRLQFVSNRKVPSITADDAAVQNIDLKDRIKELEAENGSLRDQVKSLDRRTSKLSKEVLKSASMDDGVMREQLHKAEQECEELREKCENLETRNTKLNKELKSLQKSSPQDKGGGTKTEPEGDEKGKLQKKIQEKDKEVGDLLNVVKGKEEENEKLLEEIEVYRQNITKMLDTFRVREKELLEEVEAVGQKNNVLSNLLDLVTERAESTQRELDKYTQGETPTPSERSASTVSAISDVSTGSDDVFVQKASGSKDWEDKLKKKIESLEQMLAEEREKVQTVEKKLASQESSKASSEQDAAMHNREKDLLKKELSLCQKQLKDATDQVSDLKSRLAKVEEAHSAVRKDFAKVSKELEQELIQKATKAAEDAKKAEIEAKEKAKEKEKEKEKEKDSKFKDEPRPGPRTIRSSSIGALAGKFERAAAAEREPIGWRFEKQEMERKIKDLTKKVEDQDKLSRKPVSKFRVPGALPATEEKKEDKEKEKPKVDDKALEETKKELKEQKERCDKLQAQIKDFQKQISEVQNSLKTKERQWNSEKSILEIDKKAALKEASQKTDIIKQKDDIIKTKDKLIKDKDLSLQEKEKSLKAKTEELSQKEKELSTSSSSSKQSQNDLKQLKDKVKDKERSLMECEAKIKTLDETVRNRDDRLKEKDDILEKLNRTLAEKESEANDMDNSIRQAMKKLDDKEAELKTVKEEQEKVDKELKELQDKHNELQEKYQKVLKSHSNEVASLVISREKMEVQADTITKEKKVLEQEIDKLKQMMSDRGYVCRRCREKPLQDRFRGSTTSSQESEAISSLKRQVESLENEKAILADEVKKIRRERDEANRAWSVEREDLQKIISEKTNMVEDNDTICRKMEEEMMKLKKKLAFASTKTKGQPSEDEVKQEKGEKETSEKEWKHKEEKEKDTKESLMDKSAKDEQWMKTQLERQELVFKAEKVSIEELYEQKLRTTQEQLAQALAETENLKRDVAAQKELLATSSKALSDMKSKFDTSSTTWNQERQVLEKRCKELDQARQNAFDLQMKADDLQSRLKEEETKCKKAESKYKTDKSTWDIEKADLTSKLTKLEDQVATNPRAKFRQLERKDTALEKERAENRKLLSEAQKVSRDLQKQLAAAEKAREQEQKEMVARLDANRAAFEKEQKELRDRLSALEAKSEQLSPVQSAMIDLQYKLQADREAWLRERSELQRQLDDSRKAHLSDKQRFTELLAETKKLRALTPMLEEPLSPTSPTTPGLEKHKVATVIELSASGSRVTTPEGVSIKKSVQEALRHISRLAEELNRTESRTERWGKPPSAPPAFRRSLSTSEMEAYQAYEENPMIPLYVGQQYLMPSEENLLSPHSLDQSPQASPGGGVEHHSRSIIRRSLSTMDAGTGGRAYPRGTQSAYTSRDASPDKRWGIARKAGPYPQPPPSMIVTPPHTPRRPPHNHSILTTENMSRLYEKLGAIGRSEEDIAKSSDGYQALASERAGRLRVLTKSASVDGTSLEGTEAYLASAPAVPGPGPMKYTHLKQAARIFEDAPKSQTLPASIRIGELVITPGIDKLTKTFTPKILKSKSKLSPAAVRKDFYDNYPQNSRAFFEDLARKHKQESAPSSPPSGTGLGRRQRDSRSEPRRIISPVNLPGEPHSMQRNKSGSGPVAAFLASIKDKRKLFSAKKSSSVDNSAVHSSLARIGIQVPLAPGAPSTYEPPQVPEKQHQKEHRETTRDIRRKLFGHKRSQSVDASLNTSTTVSASTDTSSTSRTRGNLHQVGRSSSSSLNNR